MEQNKVYHYSLDDIKKIVQQEKIKVVSFDLFENLLVRPRIRLGLCRDAASCGRRTAHG